MSGRARASSVRAAARSPRWWAFPLGQGIPFARIAEQPQAVGTGIDQKMHEPALAHEIQRTVFVEGVY